MSTMTHRREVPRPEWAWLPVAVVWAGFLAMVLVMEHRWAVRLAIVAIGVAVEVGAAVSRRRRPAPFTQADRRS